MEVLGDQQRFRIKTSHRCELVLIKRTMQSPPNSEEDMSSEHGITIEKDKKKDTDQPIDAKTKLDIDCHWMWVKCLI